MVLIASHEVYRTSSLSLNLHPKNYDYLTPDFHFFATQSLNDLDVLKRRMTEHKNDPLHRLEVETTSTTSLPLSFPYYNFSDNANSFDTFDILKKSDQDGDTKGVTFNNVAHLNHRKIGGLPVKDSQPHESSIKGHFEDDLFNPVPKRFSEFIKDQQSAPPKPIESLTSASESIGSTSITYKTKKSRSSGSFRNRPSSSIPKSRSSAHGDQTLSLNRQISDTMGSQATIFSTRPEGRETSRNLTSPRGTNLYTTTSQTTSNLSRRKAIRFKQGSLLYRMRLKLKKIINRLKQMRFKGFRVSSKRTANGSIRRAQSKGKAAKRKFKLGPRGASLKRYISISAPVNNPRLGKGGIQKVQALDDEIKQLAGAPIENTYITRPSADIKFNYLSSYIDAQQDLYFTDMERKTESINFERDREGKIASSTGKNRAPSEARSDSSSIPPPVPPHVVKQRVPSLNTSELWRRYLAHVIAKRIQLRQEIRLFQEILATKQLPVVNYATTSSESVSCGSTTGSAQVNDDILTETGTISDDDYETMTQTSEALSGTIETGSVNSRPYVDSDTEKFNQKLDNRKSVLGEMLDYDSSDAEATATEVSGDSRASFRGSSLAGSSLNIGKQYSVRRTKLHRSLSSMSQHNHQTSPIRRSEGIMGLSSYK